MRYRSAITGKFITRLEAIQSPDTTVSEGVLGQSPIVTGDEERVNPFHINMELDQMDIAQAVQTSIGAASACWSNLEGAGDFMTEFAIDIAEQLVHRIEQEVKSNGNYVPS